MKPAAPDADAVIAALKQQGTQANIDAMARYAIPSDKAFGVTVGTLGGAAKLRKSAAG